jgi:hypothetical protein
MQAGQTVDLSRLPGNPTAAPDPAIPTQGRSDALASGGAYGTAVAYLIGLGEGNEAQSIPAAVL